MPPPHHHHHPTFATCGYSGTRVWKLYNCLCLDRPPSPPSSPCKLFSQPRWLRNLCLISKFKTVNVVVILRWSGHGWMVLESILTIETMKLKFLPKKVSSDFVQDLSWRKGKCADNCASMCRCIVIDSTSICSRVYWAWNMSYNLCILVFLISFFRSL